MRRTHALFATSAIFAVGLLAVLLATLTHSTLAATTVLAGVAILIAIAECGQFIVLGPLVAEIAPPHLLGRYMSLYQLSFMVGVALGQRSAACCSERHPTPSGGAAPWRWH